MPQYEIVAVRDAVRVLKELARLGDGVALWELAAEVKMTKTKVFRILATLEAEGLAQREDEYWGLGDEALRLWESYRKRNDHKGTEDTKKNKKEVEA